MAEEEPTFDRDAETMATSYDAPKPGDSTITEDMPIKLPEKIGRYHIKRVIAAGGMGVVYEALQEHPRRTVALKIMKQGIASRSALRRFEYESQILARLRHPGIAQVYEAGMHDDGSGGVPYFAMEYVAGAKDLCEYAEAKELPTVDRLDLFDKVCDAVHHGHQKGIIHRDLKPQNILVDSTGQPKIIDFGVARATDSDLAMPTLQTDVGQLIGTVQYMSPEQINADPHDIDTRSDVYALGVVLYKLLTNKLPYDVSGSVLHEATRMIQEQSPKRPSTIVRTLKGDIETVCLHALEKDRDRRYQSAIELTADIRRYLNNRPILARPPSVTYHFTTFVKRNKAIVAAIAAVFVVLVTGVVGTTWQWTRAEEQRVQAEAQRDRAERMFGQVRQLANTFMFEFHDAIQKLDGSMEARELVVTSALEYLDGLTKEAGDDPDLMKEVATAYDRVGDMIGGFTNPSEGDTRAALKNYNTARRIRATLLEADPENQMLLTDCAANHQRVGDIYDKIGESREALTEYEANLAIREKLKDSKAQARYLSWALNDIGSVQVKLGQLDEARKSYDRSLEVIRKRAADDTGNKRLQRDVSVAYGRVAAIFIETGDIDAALRRYREMLRIRQDLLDQEDTGRYRRDVAISHFFIARAYLLDDQADKALDHGRKFLAVSEQGHLNNPADWRYARDLAAANDIVGRALMHEDNDTGLTHLDAAVTMISDLAAEHSKNKHIRELWGRYHASRGLVKEYGGRSTDAVADYQEALAIIDSLSAADPENIEFHQLKAQAMWWLGSALAAIDEDEEAEFQLQSAREILDRLVRENPERALFRKDLVGTLSELAIVMADAGERRESKRFADKAVSAAGEADPVALRALARARHTNGDHGGAIEAADEALDLLAGISGPFATRLRGLLEAERGMFADSGGQAP